MRVDLAQVTETGWCRFAADASDLGLAPGTVPPAEIFTDIGNGLPFVATRSDQDMWRYSQPNGCCDLVIFND